MDEDDDELFEDDIPPKTKEIPKKPEEEASAANDDKEGMCPMSSLLQIVIKQLSFFQKSLKTAQIFLSNIQVSI